LADKSNIVEAKSLALRYLSYRSRSIREATERLKRQGFSDSTIKATIDRLIELDYLDDNRFALEWTHSMVRNKNLGRKRIMQGLKEKGIDMAIRERIMVDLGDSKEMLSARSALQSWCRKTPVKDRPQSKKRLSAYRYLIRKGFSSATAQTVLNDLFGESDTDESR
jgi:regulatory protein